MEKEQLINVLTLLVRWEILYMLTPLWLPIVLRFFMGRLGKKLHGGWREFNVQVLIFFSVIGIGLILLEFKDSGFAIFVFGFFGTLVASWLPYAKDYEKEVN